MYKKRVYKNKRLTTITVKREADLGKAISVLETFFKDNNTENLLLNIGDSSFDNMTHNNIRNLYKFANSRTDDKGSNKYNGKTALVCSNDLQNNIDKIFKTYSEIEDSVIDVSVFRSEERALGWLEEG